MRCFIAIDIPKELKKSVEALQEKLCIDGIRLVAPENLHLTLKFLGELDENCVNITMNKLQSVKAQPFTAEVSGIGAFPTARHANVIWLGVEPKEKLCQLADAINTALSSRDAFIPHITIARVKKPCRLAKKLDEMKEIVIGSFIISSFALKKSALTAKGPVYTTIREFDLK